MPTGISLHIGLNNVDPAAYDGWNATLDACLNDADDMLAIAAGLGFQTSVLKEGQATRNAVTNAISAAAQQLSDGDFFLITYAGHGGQVLDVSGDETDDDTDETWCLYDGQLLDDELRALWPNFASGVRIFGLSDSCHSGSVMRALIAKKRTAKDLSEEELLAIYGSKQPKFRYMPRRAAIRAYRENFGFYDAIQNNLPKPLLPVSATVRLISGCQDDQLSGEGFGNGLFTSRLKQVWDDNKFQGNYSDFHQAIVAQMPADQTPNHSVFGANNPAFDAEKPFTI